MPTRPYSTLRRRRGPQFRVRTERDTPPPDENTPESRERTIWSKLDILIHSLPPDPPVRPHEWWVAQTLPYDGRECPKCAGLTRGEYLAPGDRLGECAVIEKCLICAWEAVHISGRHGRPYQEES